jgi:hypothetical protein
MRVTHINISKNNIFHPHNISIFHMHYTNYSFFHAGLLFPLIFWHESLPAEFVYLILDFLNS